MAENKINLPAGSTVYTICHVSQSGMSRVIAAYYLESSELRWIDLHDLLGLRMHKTEHGYVVRGAGMDMAYDVVYRLGLTLHHDGYSLRHRAL